MVGVRMGLDLMCETLYMAPPPQYHSLIDLILCTCYQGDFPCAPLLHVPVRRSDELRNALQLNPISSRARIDVSPLQINSAAQRCGSASRFLPQDSIDGVFFLQEITGPDAKY